MTAPGHLTARVLVAAAAVAPAQGRYSPQKFLAFHEYARRTSVGRVVYVIVVTPLLGLLAALVPALIPLAPLREGPTPAFYAHLCVMMIFVGWGSIMPVIKVAGVPASIYSAREAVVVSVVSAVVHTALLSPLCRHWRFPVPFMWVIGASMWAGTILLTHVLVLRAKCWRTDHLVNAVRTNHIGVALELLQVFLYPAISILFDHVSEGYQIVITMAFPLIKYALKKILKRTTRHLQDQHAVVVIAAVEICSSMYQSIVLQSTPSRTAIAIIMGLDVLQGLHSIRYMLDGHRVRGVTRRDVVPAALEILRREFGPDAGSVHLAPPRGAAILPTPVVHVKPQVTRALSKRDHQTVQSALQLLHNAETIVLLEYFEVIVPLINCAFVAIAAHLPEAFYNLTIARFYHHPARLAAAVGSIFLYSTLQAGSCLVLHVVLRHRYGLSASHVLGFVLERHREAIQAKMVAWLPIILHFMTAHYGTDFTFSFEFHTWEQW